MKYLELLAPARNLEIGIAAIDCGADAVDIAGPDFGARKAAGNSFEDIRKLCEYAHRFGVKVFVTYNTLIREDERAEAHSQMLLAQEAGADAFIVRDPVIFTWDDLDIALHASTQCAIRDKEKAKSYLALGVERIVLERELSLEKVREIAEAVSPCEIEFFVHGALCVCYSGDCRLSEYIDGRSADRGECIQACRSLYDVYDSEGKMILRNKAVLSLKDYNLKARLEDLAEAGVMSFKIEGRLKNASYVKNVVRDYDLALNALVAKYPEKYARASFGRVTGGFAPDTAKTFNRGYTELYIDGKRGLWSSMDAPKSMGEPVGKVTKIRRFKGRGMMEVELKPLQSGLVLKNGDGFSFATRDGVTGFRGDLCEGMSIKTKDVESLREGYLLYRNINLAFEKELDTKLCRREIPVSVELRISGDYVLELRARSSDGREILSSFNADVETAENRERAEAMLREQLSKRSGIYAFSLDSLVMDTKGGALPLLSVSTINSIRRLLAEDLSSVEISSEKGPRPRLAAGEESLPPRLSSPVSELMRSKYCLRYELGLCSRQTKDSSPLYLENNGRRFRLSFDCAACEMVLTK